MGFGAYVVIPDLFRDLLTQSSLQMRFFLLLHIGLYYLSSPPGGSTARRHPEQCEGSSEGLSRFDLGFGAYVVIPDLFRDLLTRHSLQKRFFT
ncbi:hypothetical protein [Fibrobacter sp.]|uniref:hypothetical protein n=1 Tax=Fibrobacter sp. TaxID=35828 RepID=UPI0025BAA28E|nr:hypothetical protein [Fibrobacter sp.]MBR3072421.1 hypothetical protein [Fibrobacter sp.]